MDRYKEVITQMLADGTAYHCYMSREELDQLRAEQEAKKQKPRYDGRWRPEAGKTLPAVPAGVQPVVRFRNPQDGVVAWDDQVKGRIEIANAELDDFIIARDDGTPTYNFCVVVDDWDMQITHVIRGDDHVNNTPRQINVLQALGAPVPLYAHLSMILGDDGQKLSKRHGAVSVMQYDEHGYLPEAVLNYLARLGWSHGNDEVFDMAQFCQWFDLDHITASAAQFNTEKLDWLNAHYIKQADEVSLQVDTLRRLQAKGHACEAPAGMNLPGVIALYKERVANLNALAAEVGAVLQPAAISAELRDQHLTAAAITALQSLAGRLQALAEGEWQVEKLAQALKETLAEQGLKMPQLAIPLRVMLLSQAQSPAIDRLLAVMGRDCVLQRLAAVAA
jgi:glutamyl-tRNA synthetase